MSDQPGFLQLLRLIDDVASAHALSADAREALREAVISSSLPGTSMVEAPHDALTDTMIDDWFGLEDGPETTLDLGGPSVTSELDPADAPGQILPRGVGEWPSHYTDMGLIGRGGLGEVRRVFDRSLGRTMVMKVLRKDVLTLPHSLSRFLEEAQITAQLQHPGIVPVHELGRLADGRIFFTMKEVKGRTFDEVIRDVHDASRDGTWRPGQRTGWTFRRLIDAFHRVCDAVAYAHSRGVVHRDLKPANIMVGRYGEVLVLDWGLAKVKGAPLDEPEAELVVTDRSRDSALTTRVGTVAGTPSYMAPEQARGQIDLLGPPTDVYAMGAILYHVLTGRPLYGDGNAVSVLRDLLSGPPKAARFKMQGPEALQHICERAMSWQPEDRYADAAALGAEIAKWQEGALARERALEVVTEADELLPEIASLEAEVGTLMRQSEQALEGVQPYDPEDAKRLGWELEDQALRTQREAELKKVTYLQQLRSALNDDPALEEAHHRLSEFYARQHAEAEAARETQVAAQFEVLLRAHDPGRYQGYLRGEGALTLFTDPPGAEVVLHRYVVRGRRLQRERVKSLGQSPIIERPLPMGSYLLELKAPGRMTVRYPVLIERQGHWDGIAPGEVVPTPVVLPPEGSLGEDDIYIPAGYFMAGGDAESYHALPRQKVWVDAFVMRRFPVTNAEYVRFLDELVAQGREDMAVRHAPRERAPSTGGPGVLLYGRDKAGRFVLQADPDGDIWEADWPAVMIDWFGASAYARWWAERSGQPWELPGDLQWEKAARGVDGRFFPWGDFVDPTWANLRDSHPGASRMVPVTAFPIDVSPFGVRGMAGNVLDWCRDAFRAVEDEGRSTAQARRLCRGGSLACRLQSARLAKREGCMPANRDYDLGFRLARPWHR